MKRCKYHDGIAFGCGSYAFNLDKIGIDQGNLCDVHYYKKQRDELLSALKLISESENCPAILAQVAINAIKEVEK